MPRQRSRWAAVFTLCVLTAAGSRCEDTRRPLLACAEPCFNFGVLPASHEGVSHSFEVKNTGAETIEVLAVRTSCDCLTAELARKIMRPGEILALPIHLAFQGRSGVQRRALHLVYRTHDAPPDFTWTLTLTVQGTILTPVMRSPDSLDLGVQVPGGTVTERWNRRRRGACFQHSQCGVDRVDAHADFEGRRRASATIVWSFRSRSVQARSPGSRSPPPTCRTCPKCRSYQVSPPRSSGPALRHRRPARDRADASLTLVSAHRIAFRVTHAHATDARIRVTLDLAGSQPCIHVTSNAPAETLHGAIVRIATDHPICRVIEVPIRSSIASARM